MKKVCSVFFVVILLFLMPLSVFAASSGYLEHDLTCSLNGTVASTGVTYWLRCPLSGVVDVAGLDVLNSYTMAYDGYLTVYLSGFSGNFTYDGYMQMPGFLSFASSGSIYAGAASGSVSNLALPVTLSQSGLDWYISAPNQYPTIVSVEAVFPDGSEAPVELVNLAGGVLLTVPNVYFPAGSGVELRYHFRVPVGMTRLNTADARLSAYDYLPYYGLAMKLNNQKPFFAGDRTFGRVDDADLTASIINNKLDEVSSDLISDMDKNAAAQASQSAKEHEDTVNGYDNTAGNQANDKLQEGISSYESEEDQAHQDFNDKMDGYENPDISDYVSGISFISSAMVMWWNALGVFKVVILVGFSLVIFEYISRFKGG